MGKGNRGIRGSSMSGIRIFPIEYILSIIWLYHTILRRVYNGNGTTEKPCIREIRADEGKIGITPVIFAITTAGFQGS